MEHPSRIALDRPPLRRGDLLEDPMDQFRAWLNEAREETALALPEAACLSTVSASGEPDGRMILVRGVDDHGLVFYTDKRSRKGAALAALPKAALTLYWEPLRRQVRFRGEVVEISGERSDAYFSGRPRGSQIAAWASEQSAPLEGREVLDRRHAELEARFAGGEIPRPPNWGGFRIVPKEAEFWQEGTSRLHDRFLYTRNKKEWNIIRLQP